MNRRSICNIDYDNQLNLRINNRVFPSQELQPNYDPRPQATKYTQFMTVDKNQRNEEKVELRNYNKFNTSQVFYTGDSKAPTQYYLDSIDVESKLKNQFFALQKHDLAQYVPSTNSSLYTNKQHGYNEVPSKLEVNGLNYKINNNRNKCNLAPNLFNNSTRYNVKNA